MAVYQLKFGPDWIEVKVVGKSGTLESNLKGTDSLYNTMIDGVESLILAHACAGVDITEKAYKEGVLTTLEKIENLF